MCFVASRYLGRWRCHAAARLLLRAPDRGCGPFQICATVSPKFRLPDSTAAGHCGDYDARNLLGSCNAKHQSHRGWDAR